MRYHGKRLARALQEPHSEMSMERPQEKTRACEKRSRGLVRWARNVSAAQIRSPLRHRFEANRDIADTQAMDLLLLRE